MTKLQLNKIGSLNHLLTIEGLKEDLIFEMSIFFSRTLNSINVPPLKSIPKFKPLKKIFLTYKEKVEI